MGRLTEDKKKAEVVVPGLDAPIYPQRKAVLPLKETPPHSVSRYASQVENEEFQNDCCKTCAGLEGPWHDMSLECSPGLSCDNDGRRRPPSPPYPPPPPMNPPSSDDLLYTTAAATASEASVQAQNVMAVMSNDPEWEAKVDFSVPPPPSPQMADGVNFPVMPTTPPHSAGPILVVPIPLTTYNNMFSSLPATPSPAIPPPLPMGMALPPPHPMPGTPLFRMPNSPIAFQFPTPLPSPMSVVPPHQVFTFPEYQEEGFQTTDL